MFYLQQTAASVTRNHRLLITYRSDSLCRDNIAKSFLSLVTLIPEPSKTDDLTGTDDSKKDASDSTVHKSNVNVCDQQKSPSMKKGNEIEFFSLNQTESILDGDHQFSMDI